MTATLLQWPTKPLEWPSDEWILKRWAALDALKEAGKHLWKHDCSEADAILIIDQAKLRILDEISERTER